MRSSRSVLIAVVLLLGSQIVSAARAEGPTKDLLNLKSPDIAKRMSANQSSDQVTAAVSKDPAAPGLVITIQPGKADYPGMNLKPERQGVGPLGLRPRRGPRGEHRFQDGPVCPPRGQRRAIGRTGPWNTEQVYLKPGERATVTVIFGHQYGHKPGYRAESEGSGEYPHVHRQGRYRDVLPRRIAGGRRPGGRESGPSIPPPSAPNPGTASCSVRA